MDKFLTAFNKYIKKHELIRIDSIINMSESEANEKAVIINNALNNNRKLTESELKRVEVKFEGIYS